MTTKRHFGTLAAFWAVALSSAWSIPFDTTVSSQYLIIGTQRVGTNTDVHTSNFELGANKAPVPSTTSFLDSGGGPTLLGAVPNLPSNAATVFSGIGGHGNVAVTDPTGLLALSDVGVYADPSIGIRLAGAKVGNGSSLNTSSNSFFNDPNQFPNTYDPLTQTGVNVNPGAAVQSTRIDANGTPGNAGVTYSFNHTPLITELALARTSINLLSSTGALNTSAGAGTLSNESGKVTTLTGSGGATITFSMTLNNLGGYDATITLPSGLSVIDLMTGGNDFKLDKANLVINGAADSSAIFRVQDSQKNMQISNSNILVGNGGIGDHNVLFYTDQDENDKHFDFNNTIINGVSFWSLGSFGGSIGINNAQGCTQLIADIVDLNDVRFNGCGFGPEPPPPGPPVPESLPGLFGSIVLAGLAGIHALARHRNSPGV